MYFIALVDKNNYNHNHSIYNNYDIYNSDDVKFKAFLSKDEFGYLCFSEYRTDVLHFITREDAINSWISAYPELLTEKSAKNLCGNRELEVVIVEECYKFEHNFLSFKTV